MFSLLFQKCRKYRVNMGRSYGKSDKIHDFFLKKMVSLTFQTNYRLFTFLIINKTMPRGIELCEKR
jgi:hypothetical protein